MRVTRCAVDRHDITGKPLRLLRRDDERLNGAADLVVGVDDREAGLRDDRSHEIVAALLDQFGCAMEDAVSLVWFETNGLERPPGGSHSGCDLLG